MYSKNPAVIFVSGYWNVHATGFLFLKTNENINAKNDYQKNDWKPLSIVAKLSILDDLLGSWLRFWYNTDQISIKYEDQYITGQ